MRVLPLSIAGLIIANLIIFWWPSGADSAGHVHRPKDDINPHFVRLNKEIEDRFYASEGIKTSNASFPNLSGLASSEVDGFSCYRLGPFAHSESYELAQAVLFNAELSFTKSIRKSKESNVYRVYLGPYDGLATAKDVRTDLKNKKVLDHFVRKEANGQYIVSLGIYTTLETANKAVALFDGKVGEVQLKGELVVLPESLWLHFSVNENDTVRKELALIDWGESAAKMGKYQCQT